MSRFTTIQRSFYQQVFNSFSEHNDFVNEHELAFMLQVFGPQVRVQEAVSLIQRYDSTGTEVLCFDDFLLLLYDYQKYVIDEQAELVAALEALALRKIHSQSPARDDNGHGRRPDTADDSQSNTFDGVGASRRDLFGGGGDASHPHRVAYDGMTFTAADIVQILRAPTIEEMLNALSQDIIEFFDPQTAAALADRDEHDAYGSGDDDDSSVDSVSVTTTGSKFLNRSRAVSSATSAADGVDNDDNDDVVDEALEDRMSDEDIEMVLHVLLLSSKQIHTFPQSLQQAKVSQSFARMIAHAKLTRRITLPIFLSRCAYSSMAWVVDPVCGSPWSIDNMCNELHIHPENVVWPSAHRAIDYSTGEIVLRLYNASNMEYFSRTKFRSDQGIAYHVIDPCVRVMCEGASQFTTVLSNELRPEWCEDLKISYNIPLTDSIDTQRYIESTMVTFDMFDLQSIGIIPHVEKFASCTVPLAFFLRSALLSTVHTLQLEPQHPMQPPVQLEISIRCKETQHVPLVEGFVYPESVWLAYNQQKAMEVPPGNISRITFGRDTSAAADADTVADTVADARDTLDTPDGNRRRLGKKRGSVNMPQPGESDGLSLAAQAAAAEAAEAKAEAAKVSAAAAADAEITSTGMGNENEYLEKSEEAFSRLSLIAATKVVLGQYRLLFRRRHVRVLALTEYNQLDIVCNFIAPIALPPWITTAFAANNNDDDHEDPEIKRMNEANNGARVRSVVRPWTALSVCQQIARIPVAPIFTGARTRANGGAVHASVSNSRFAQHSDVEEGGTVAASIGMLLQRTDLLAQEVAGLGDAGDAKAAAAAKRLSKQHMSSSDRAKASIRDMQRENQLARAHRDVKNPIESISSQPASRHPGLQLAAPMTMLARKHGNELEHCLFLCGALLWLELDAYVCCGEDAYGPRHWVVVRDLLHYTHEEDRNDPHMEPYRVLHFDAVRGVYFTSDQIVRHVSETVAATFEFIPIDANNEQKTPLSSLPTVRTSSPLLPTSDDVAVPNPFLRVGSLFNDQDVYLNCQEHDDTSRINWDFQQTNDWMALTDQLNLSAAALTRKTTLENLKNERAQRVAAEAEAAALQKAKADKAAKGGKGAKQRSGSAAAQDATAALLKLQAATNAAAAEAKRAAKLAAETEAAAAAADAAAYDLSVQGDYRYEWKWQPWYDVNFLYTLTDLATPKPDLLHRQHMTVCLVSAIQQYRREKVFVARTSFHRGLSMGLEYLLHARDTNKDGEVAGGKDGGTGGGTFHTGGGRKRSSGGNAKELVAQAAAAGYKVGAMEGEIYLEEWERTRFTTEGVQRQRLYGHYDVEMGGIRPFPDDVEAEDDDLVVDMVGSDAQMVILDEIPDHHIWHFATFHFQTASISHVMGHLIDSGILDVSVPNTHYAIAVSSISYPWGLQSVWIYIGYLYDVADAKTTY